MKRESEYLTDEDRSTACTCKENCPRTCKGDCGCKFCSEVYEEYLNQWDRDR